MPNTFFTADTHFGHDNILIHAERPHKTVEEMDDDLVTRWNARVKPEDTVWHLGDFAWRNHLLYRKKLNGKIVLIRGNHDKMTAGAKSGFDAVYDVYYGCVLGAANSVKFYLHHYPMVSWPRKSWGLVNGTDYGRGVAHLYGHVHGRYDYPGGASIDVGVDAHNYQPIAYDEVVSLIEHKVKTSGHSPCHDTRKKEDTT